MWTAARRGFTLLEGVVALAIVGVAVVAVLGAFAGDLRATERVRRALVAETLAEERLATLRLLGSTELARLPDSLRRGAFGGALGEYRWTMQASRVRGEDGLFDLRVRIEWPRGAYVLASRGYAPPDRGGTGR